MARDHGRIRHRMWGDPDFLALREAEQRLFMMALSQAGLSYAGVVPFTLRRWQGLAADSTLPKLRKAVSALQDARYVVVDQDSEELLIRSFVRHDGILDSPNICRAMVRDADTVCSPLLRAVIICECVKLLNEDPREGNEKSWDEVVTPWLGRTLPETFGETFPGTLTRTQLETLEAVEKGTLDLTISSARAAPSPSPFHSIPRSGRAAPGTFCDVHHQNEPCTGCAADRKARTG